MNLNLLSLATLFVAMHLSVMALANETTNKQEYVEVISAEIAETDTFIKSHPYTKDTILFASSMDTKDNKTMFLSASLPSPHLKKDVIFLGLLGNNFCGSMGCALHVYTDNGTGYKDSLDIVMFGKVFLSQNDRRMDIVFCTPTEHSKWIYADNKFVYSINYNIFAGILNE